MPAAPGHVCTDMLETVPVMRKALVKVDPLPSARPPTTSTHSPVPQDRREPASASGRVSVRPMTINWTVLPLTASVWFEQIHGCEHRCK